MPKMKATIFIKPGRIALEKADPRYRSARRADAHDNDDDMRHRHPYSQGRVSRGKGFNNRSRASWRHRKARVVGHKAFTEGQRVIAGAITPSGHRRLLVRMFEPGWTDKNSGFKAMGGWRFGNTIDGCQAEYVLRARCDGRICARAR